MNDATARFFIGFLDANAENQYRPGYGERQRIALARAVACQSKVDDDARATLRAYADRIEAHICAYDCFD